MKIFFKVNFLKNLALTRESGRERPCQSGLAAISSKGSYQASLTTQRPLPKSLPARAAVDSTESNFLGAEISARSSSFLKFAQENSGDLNRSGRDWIKKITPHFLRSQHSFVVLPLYVCITNFGASEREPKR